MSRPIKILFEKGMLCEAEKVRNHTPRTLSPPALSSTRRPSLEEKQLLWATFSCRKIESGAESPSESVQNESGGESLSEPECQCASKCVMVGRTVQDLQVETGNSPSNSDQASLKNISSSPSPPTAPRAKEHSPKDIKEIRQMSVNEGGQQVHNVTAERESPTSRPPTPPTVPRTRKAPSIRKRLVTPGEISGSSSSDEAACERAPSTHECTSVEDFRQCPSPFCDKLRAKFCPSAACHPEPVALRKKAPALTANQLGRTEDANLSENWKRFEQRKLERKERNHSKKRSHPLIQEEIAAEVLHRSTYELRLWGLMASKLAQPPDAFSHRSPSMMEDSMSLSQTECTAFRKWHTAREEP